jgi:hypothetical protein
VDPRAGVDDMENFRLKMVIRPKHVALTEQNIQTSVALGGNPEPDMEKLKFVTLPELERN